MPVRQSEAEWKGDLQHGQGKVRLGSGAYDGPYSFQSRFENGSGTNPEELLAAAHAGCFTMALANELTKAGHKPDQLHTTAKVSLVKKGEGFQIPTVELALEASVPDIDEATFQRVVETAKMTCPVSKLFASAEITLQAHLLAKASS
jgi:osmotically inducible protein OsmC